LVLTLLETAGKLLHAWKACCVGLMGVFFLHRCDPFKTWQKVNELAYVKAFESTSNPGFEFRPTLSIP